MTRRWTTMPDNTATFVGKGFQSSFIGNGTQGNEWMHQEDQNIDSEKSLDILKYDCRLVGIDYTNANQNSDSQFLIAVADFGNGATIDRSYKWTVTNARTSIKSDELGGPEFNAGDKIGMYVVDNGGNAFDIVVTMDFVVTAVGGGMVDMTENWSQDFKFNDFPAIGTIPELFT